MLAPDPSHFGPIKLSALRAALHSQSYSLRGNHKAKQGQRGEVSARMEGGLGQTSLPQHSAPLAPLLLLDPCFCLCTTQGNLSTHCQPRLAGIPFGDINFVPSHPQLLSWLCLSLSKDEVWLGKQGHRPSWLVEVSKYEGPQECREGRTENHSRK